MMPPELDRIRIRIDDYLRRVINDMMLQGPYREHPLVEKVYAWMQHYLVNSGRRMHGICVVLAAEACGGNQDDSIPVAAALQLYHHHTLIHDDIYDQDQSRRGWPTTHAMFADVYADARMPSRNAKSIFVDEAQRRGAIIAFAYGKVCRALAYQILTDSSFRAQTLLEVVRAWDRHDVYDSIAQILDVHHEQDLDLKAEDCLANAYAKTGRLFELCAYAGSHLYEVDEARKKTLQYWAGQSGLAYQVQDDLEDIAPLSEKGQGRGIGSDLFLGKATYLYALARENATAAERVVLDCWQSADRTGLELGDITHILARTEAVRRAELKVREIIADIAERLREIFAESVCSKLVNFTEYFVSPDYWRRKIAPDAGRANMLVGVKR